VIKKAKTKEKLTNLLYSAKREELVGREVIIIADTAGHGYSRGTKCVIRSMPNQRQDHDAEQRIFGIQGVNSKNIRTNNAYAQDLRLIPATLEEFQTEKELHDFEGSIINEKVEFLKETKLSVFNASGFAAWKIMKLFDVDKETMDEKGEELEHYLAL